MDLGGPLAEVRCIQINPNPSPHEPATEPADRKARARPIRLRPSQSGSLSASIIFWVCPEQLLVRPNRQVPVPLPVPWGALSVGLPVVWDDSGLFSFEELRSHS